jgi:hypothetical protein
MRWEKGLSWSGTRCGLPPEGCFPKGEATMKNLEHQKVLNYVDKEIGGRGNSQKS